MTGYPRAEPYFTWKHEKRRLKQIEEREAAEASEREAFQARKERRERLWSVPESAKDAYIEMAESIGTDSAEKILAFIEAMKDAS